MMYQKLYRCFWVLLIALASCSGLEDPFNENNRAVAVENHADGAMQQALEQILQWHREHTTGISDALQPGLSRADILEKFEDLPCRPTEELIQLWSWHDGVETASTPFIWYHDFLPLDKAVATYKRFTINRLTGLGWKRNWIPVFEFEGEWYFTECYDEVRPAGPVGYLFIEETRTYYSYLNLTRMMQTQAEWLRQGMISWNYGTEAMEENIQEMAEVYRKLNEGAEFPYNVE